MERQEHKFRTGQRVKLKSDGQDAVYAFAGSGSPGWVRKLGEDPMGYPTVFIEWDKDHWSYNGEPDKWAMEAHFDLDEESKVEDNFMDKFGGPEGFAKAFGAFLASQGEDPNLVVQKDEDKAYDKAVEAAYDLLKKGDAFIVVTVQERKKGELIPAITYHYKNARVGLVAEMQLSKLTAIAHQEAATHQLMELMEEE